MRDEVSQVLKDDGWRPHQDLLDTNILFCIIWSKNNGKRNHVWETTARLPEEAGGIFKLLKTDAEIYLLCIYNPVSSTGFILYANYSDI